MTVNVTTISSRCGGGAAVTLRRLQQTVDFSFENIAPEDYGEANTLFPQDLDFSLPESTDVAVVHETGPHEQNVAHSLRDVDIPVLKIIHGGAWFMCEDQWHGGPCTGPSVSCSYHPVKMAKNMFRGTVGRYRFDRAYDYFLTTSKYLENLLRGWGQQGRLMPNGIDPERVPYSPSQPDEPSLMLAGRLEPIKGLLDICQKLDDIPIHVFGDGSEAEAMAKEPNVIYHGFVERDELLQEYHKHTATILNSNVVETCTTVGLESMAAGTPVLANPRSAWYLMDDFNGRVFHGVDQIPDLIETLDSGHRKRSCQFIEETFTFDRTARIYEETIKNLKERAE